MRRRKPTKLRDGEAARRVLASVGRKLSEQMRKESGCLVPAETIAMYLDVFGLGGLLRAVYAREPRKRSLAVNEALRRLEEGIR